MHLVCAAQIPLPMPSPKEPKGKIVEAREEEKAPVMVQISGALVRMLIQPERRSIVATFCPLKTL
jgi:hypothetical protein